MLLVKQTMEYFARGPMDLLDRLDRCRSTRAIAVSLLPIFLLILLPIGFSENEYIYFMLPLRRVAPEQFSEFSAAFDASNARILWELLLGYPISWFGYDLTWAVMRLAMAVTYAAAIAYLLSTLELSAFDGLLVTGLFLLTGQDILGKEWLFQGVESKTLAYALIIVGLAFVMRERRAVAVCAAAVATYVHFVVGGFWLIALLLYDAMRDFSPRRLTRLLAIYALLVGPLIAVIAYQQLGSLNAEQHGLGASYIYSILRAPHHVAPFSSVEQFRRWAPDIALLMALSLSFLFLARSDLAKSRPLICWVAALLGYLVVALGLSALDARTGYLGKFYLFRPSSLTLFCAITAVLALFNGLEDKSGTKLRVRKATFLFVLPIAIFGIAGTKLSEASAERRAISEDIVRMNAFVLETSAPDGIVLIQPGGEYVFPKVALPMLLNRPTLVSLKFVPTNARDIYRWYDLLQYRDAVFTEGCKDLDRFPVRYLLMTQARDMNVPCGRIVWRSKYFALVEP